MSDDDDDEGGDDDDDAMWDDLMMEDEGRAVQASSSTMATPHPMPSVLQEVGVGNVGATGAPRLTKGSSKRCARVGVGAGPTDPKVCAADGV